MKRVCLILIFVLYLSLSLFRLGTTDVPQTAWSSDQKGSEILLDFGEETQFAGFVYYLGNYEERVFTVETGSGTPVLWNQVSTVTMDPVYQWSTVKLGVTGRYVKLTTQKVYTELKELVFLDASGKRLVPENVSSYPELFDEQECFPDSPQFYQTGVIFDEKMYARTAYEYLHGIRSYEDTHPPLGKILTSAGIALFGMNPFGWRCASVLAGTLMLLVLWWLARRFFGDSWTTILVTGIFAADFMHFTLGRVAQPESFLVLFMLLMYGCMYRYVEIMRDAESEPGHSSRQLHLWLLLSGISMGAAIACKWSGCYGAVGLAVIWLWSTAGAAKQGRLTKRDFWKITIFCILAFVLIPVGIYVGAYIPYVPLHAETGFVQGMLENQVNMFRFHSMSEHAHIQSSQWFQWPILGKPVVYSLQIQGDKLEEVVLLGNPVFWLAGLAAFFGCVSDWWSGRDWKLGILMIMFLAPMLPWMLVPRSSFLYHYFPCLPALALMLGYQAERRGKRGVLVLGGLTVGAAVCFALFYPIISGYSVSPEYIRGLEWLPWWQFQV